MSVLVDCIAWYCVINNITTRKYHDLRPSLFSSNELLYVLIHYEYMLIRFSTVI